MSDAPAVPSGVVTLAEDVLSRIEGILSPSSEGYPLHAPEIDGNSWAYVKDCLDTGWVSSVGRWVDRFEEMLTETTGARHAIATVNGTAALHAALLAAGVQPGDEVLVPAFTFVASANAIMYCDATPHFVDCETQSLGIDPVRLENHLDRALTHKNGVWRNRITGAPVRALVPVHCYGHPADMDALNAIAAYYDLTVIEDAAESLGSYIGDKHTGRFGRAGVLSFNGNKTITTGGGGAIVTDDDLFARKVRHMTTTARAGEGRELIHDAVGYNYRLPNINAALGCAQLETLSDKLGAKAALAARYENALAGLDGVEMVSERAGARSNHWLNAVVFPNSIDRDATLDLLRAHGIESRPFWHPLHRMPMYRETPKADLSVTEALAGRGLLLPSGAEIARKTVLSSIDR